MTIKEIKPKELFKIVDSKGNESKKVYFKDKNAYDRELKKYLVVNYEDINDYKFLKPTQKITTDFIY